MRIVLASASPNRREILQKAEVDFICMPSDADESADDLSPDALVTELARRKAEAVLPSCDTDDVLLAADTVAVIDGEILGKPHDAGEASRFLHLLSGRTHTVFTGVCLVYHGQQRSFFDATRVTFYALSDKEIDRYIESGAPFGKAGAYGIQGPAMRFVERIEGDFNNVIGLPAARVLREISDMTGE